MPAPPEIMESDDDDGEGGRVLWGGVLGFLEVTQGDPIPPTILNVLVDAVVRHLVYVMVEGEE